ncbi:uncharacterized protein LY79DRAFT_562407 [Colletotrichum navitas]|uniref:Uncharacterized protein n=1 Tax=Colletotrichum navitas TaxID=681940 RepID=A0AAD8PU42_9PEZI|nr:uncharacterized protein LY79DRAFT_562407 [Colletotrichum navitas]KAK1580139.1 hypothetical protein LY79DRAFT_562407 [Colletotrichum navitas]
MPSTQMHSRQDRSGQDRSGQATYLSANVQYEMPCRPSSVRSTVEAAQKGLLSHVLDPPFGHILTMQSMRIRGSCRDALPSSHRMLYDCTTFTKTSTSDTYHPHVHEVRDCRRCPPWMMRRSPRRGPTDMYVEGGHGVSSRWGGHVVLNGSLAPITIIITSSLQRLKRRRRRRR